MATATPQAPAAGAGGLKPRKLTVPDAVEQWAECTLAIEGLQILRHEAATVLLANAEKTGRRTFKDRIAVVRTGGALVLNQVKVKQYLGAALTDFQVRTRLGWSLKLLK